MVIDGGLLSLILLSLLFCFDEMSVVSACLSFLSVIRSVDLASSRRIFVPTIKYTETTEKDRNNMNNQLQQRQEEERRQDPIVTSGESDEGVLLDSDSDDHDEDDDDDGRPRLLNHPRHTHNSNNTDALYDENADDEDEAYVYKYLRGGSAEPSSSYHDKQQKVIKPRNSDAVLSCPCCFAIVCMDCQQHERYENQYRAMFVMNIIVRWDLRLYFDDKQGQLVPCGNDTAVDRNQQQFVRVVEDHGEEKHKAKQDEKLIYYYKVCCANCQTPVASLDMNDEVYHFYGCVASA